MEATIKSGNIKLEALKAVINALNSQIERTWFGKDELIIEYNQKINQYNAIQSSYNNVYSEYQRLFESYKQDISTHDNLVESYNRKIR